MRRKEKRSGKKEKEEWRGGGEEEGRKAGRKERGKERQKEGRKAGRSQELRAPALERELLFAMASFISCHHRHQQSALPPPPLPQCLHSTSLRDTGEYGRTAM